MRSGITGFGDSVDGVGPLAAMAGPGEKSCGSDMSSDWPFGIIRQWDDGT